MSMEMTITKTCTVNSFQQLHILANGQNESCGRFRLGISQVLNLIREHQDSIPAFLGESVTQKCPAASKSTISTRYFDSNQGTLFNLAKMEPGLVY